MGKIHEVLAVEEAKKTRSNAVSKETMTDFTKKRELFSGLVSVYTPVSDAEQTIRNERAIETSVSKRLDYTKNFIIDYLDVVLTKEEANTSEEASAEIIIEGEAITPKMSPTSLLAIEKNLREFRNLLAAMPTLPTGVRFEDDQNEAGVKVAPEVKKERQAKRTKFEKIFEPTEHQPGQYREISIDEPIGYTTEVHRFAMPSSQAKADMLDRCDKLLQATKQARQRANMADAKEQKVAGALFQYILG